MTVKNPVPARLFVLLAREAPVGVILRRGPTDWVQLIQWHTKTDVFKPGQWFHGRIYEHRCDLSSDGKFFVYAAFKPGNRLKNPDFGDRWTAVSKPPHFTALALWTRGNTSGGGGYFFKDGTMLLNHLDDNRSLHNAYRLPKGLEVKTIETYEDETRYMFNDIHLNVMIRDGWKSSAVFSPYFQSFSESSGLPDDKLAATLEKTKGGVTLICKIFNHHNLIFQPKKDKRIFSKIQRWAKSQKMDSLLGSYWQDFVKNPYHSRISHRYEYAIKMADSELELSDVTWAEFDRSKRLVLAKGGKVFSGKFQDGELKLTELADFNENDT